MAVERVAEDGGHRLGRCELVVDAEIVDRSADVRLCFVGDVAVVERQRVDLEPELDQLIQRVGRILAAAEQCDAVVFARAIGPCLVSQRNQVCWSLEPDRGLVLHRVVGMAPVAHTGVVEHDAGNVVGEAATHAELRGLTVPGSPRANSCAPNGRVFGERCLDFARVEADAADFQLLVDSTEIDQRLVVDEPNQVTRSIPTTAPLIEECRGVAVDVPAGQTIVGDAQFTGHPEGYRFEIGIDDLQLHAGGGATDRDVRGIVGFVHRHFVDHAADHRFGRAVLVEDPHRRRPGPNAFEQRCGECLSADDECCELVPLRQEAHEHLDMGRGGLAPRDLSALGDRAEPP